MSDNKKINKNAEAEGEKKRRLGKKSWIAIIVSSVLVLALTGCAIAGVFNLEFNYEKRDITKYISVPEELYKSFDVTVNVPEVTDKDVKEEILKLLYSKRIKPEGKIVCDDNVTISAGDVANIYFRGYTVENGIKKYFDGGCNFDGAYYELGIGEGKFVSGFESGLVGKNQQDYATLNKRTSGVVNEGDLVAITYSVYSEHISPEADKNVVIDLSDPTLDERWGEGFHDFFVGKKIDPNEMVKLANGDLDSIQVPGGTVYSHITIRSACTVDDSVKPKLIVEVTFPRDYSAEDLRGKQGFFEVYILDVADYGCYEFDDAFITDVLGIEASELSSFAGDTLADKYRSFIRQSLDNNRQSTVNALIEETFWENVMKGAEVKKLPKREVEKMYNGLLAQIISAFQSQGSSTAYANDFDAFARATLELSSSADWEAYLRKDAEEAVKEKLIFYYIVQVEGFEMTDEEYQNTYDMIFSDHLQEYLDYYSITKDTPNYEKEVAKGKKEVLDAYGEDYFDELVIYDYVMNKLAERANVTVVLG